MHGRELFLVSLLSFMLILGAIIVIDKAESTPCEAVRQPTWAPPNVQLCPDDIGLWECIRTVAYREDI